jgi:hypothetical protein
LDSLKKPHIYDISPYAGQGLQQVFDSQPGAHVHQIGGSVISHFAATIKHPLKRPTKQAKSDFLKRRQLMQL